MSMRAALLACLVAPTASYIYTASSLPRKLHSSPGATPPKHVLNLQRATSYLRSDERTINDALRFAADAHAGQVRRSGEPFITHPIATACILADLRMDCDTIVAGLLHDTVEDTPVTVDEIRARFGDAVADIVAGVTDGDDVADVNRANRLQAMSTDWRIVVVKLADRLHNMRTLQHMPRVKQRRKARETVELYVPLARSMGVHEMERELLLQSTHYLFPACATHLPPVARALGRLGSSSSLLPADMESALPGHRRAWAEHKATWACS